MSDAGPSQSVQEGKRKRRVKKKSATPAQEATPIVAAERPNKRAPLTTYDREVYDYVREATSKNVWCGLPTWSSMMHTGNTIEAAEVFMSSLREKRIHHMLTHSGTSDCQ